MTKTNAAAVNTVEKKEVTVSWSKLTDGVGLVFAGVISMLEALDAGTARDIMNCISQGEKKEGEANDAEDTGAGTVDGDAGADDAPVADTAPAVAEETDTSDPQADVYKRQSLCSAPAAIGVRRISLPNASAERTQDEEHY